MNFIRSTALSVLKRLGRDISIAHHWVPDRKITLHSFKHKGYWFHARNREHDEMLAVERLLRAGDCAIEVGGHIGYLSVWFAYLIGERGSLLVFEPSEDNARYLSKNVDGLHHVMIDCRGISDHVGNAAFYIEELTGQNNSLLKDYGVFDVNAANAGVTAERRCVEISLTTLDQVCSDRALRPDFVKIDIEGAELAALRGMECVLRNHRPIVFIEITENGAECFALFERLGYQAFNPRLQRVGATAVANADPANVLTRNFFFIHAESDRLPAQ